MADLLIVPGRGNSGPEHWQTDLEQHFPQARRVEQWDWDNPNLLRWAAAVDTAAREAATPPLLVAHSFGCLAAVHALLNWRTPVSGLFLVAPADPERFGLSLSALARPLHQPSWVLTSDNDPWLRVTTAAFLADRWGSRFELLENAGHINVDSGFGPWPAMREWVAQGRVERQPAAPRLAA